MKQGIEFKILLKKRKNKFFSFALYCIKKSIYGYLPLILLFFTACQQEEKPPGWIDTDRLMHADQETENWMSLGRNFMQHHYSPLDQVNEDNVEELGFAWEYDARSIIGRVSRGLEATPIVVDGIMYTSGAWGVVFAINAKTGEEIWRYDPEVDPFSDRKACCDVVNRGVQVWKGRVYVGTIDGYLVCLDAATGKVHWRVDTFTDRSRYYTITGPPQVAGNVVVIGNSGAEFGVRGYITAYDLESGEQAWRFFTVPGDPKKGFEHPEMEMASKTWDPNSNWEVGGGGTVWGQFAYDPELNLLYVGTGNSSPYPIWFRSPSGGDNLFLASILAINPDNGKMEWYYQTTPGEIWDYTCTMNIILADMEIDGQMHKVLMQAPKNGFFYVLDRTNGKLLSAEKFVKVTWASHVDMKTGRPVLTGEGDYQNQPKVIYPSDLGGHNWQPMSFSPKTGLVYIPSIEMGMVFSGVKNYQYSPGDMNVGLEFRSNEYNDTFEKDPPTKEEFLKAWDPVAQKEKWKIPLKGHSNGGVLSTGGDLVFQGSSSGYLYIYHAASGETLKEIHVGTGIMAAPVTYMVDGEQYVAIMAGYGGALNDWVSIENAPYEYQNYGRILAFKLGGESTPLPPKRIAPEILPPPDKKLSSESIAKGETLYFKYCSRCHGWMEEDRISLYPDLTNLTPAVHQSFKDYVLKGILSANAMVSFADVIDETEAEAIHDFLISKQQDLFEKSKNIE